MKLIQRQLLKELAANAVLTIAVLVCIFFVISLALVLGSSRGEGVPFVVLLRHTGLNIVANLHLLLPLAVLTATLFAYGRFRGEGEYTAVRVAGVRPWHVLAPAVLFGAAASCLLAGLLDEQVPRAHHMGRVELAQDLLRNVESVLLSDTVVRERNFQAHWQRRGVDAQGRLILHSIEVLEFDGEAHVRAHTVASRALPHFDARTGVLHLNLSAVRRWSREQGTSAAAELRMDLPLEEFSDREAVPRKNAGRSAANLVAMALRADAEASRSSGEAAAEAQRTALQARDERGFRMAFAFAPLCFAIFGAGLGLLRGNANRLIVFLIGFLLVAGAYYPLAMLSRWLYTHGAVPSIAVHALGDVLLLLASLLFLRRLERP
ncbi:MAG: LptF/LptG family permease [Planctomycetes bacterium]|nr:LptF/LptG family permease [Planctomycetota bacterium]